MQCYNIVYENDTTDQCFFLIKTILSTFMTDDVISLVTSGNVMEAASSKSLDDYIKCSPFIRSVY